MVDKKISGLSALPSLPLHKDSLVEVSIPDGSSPTGFSTFKAKYGDIVPKGIYTPNILYVDDIAGDDLTGEKGYPSKQYATVDAATAAAVAGDIVMVERGDYFIQGIKPDVVYYFGVSNIQCVNFITSAYGEGSFKVFGHANFVCNNALINSINNSTVQFECNNLQYYSTCISGSMNTVQIDVKCHFCEGLSAGAFVVYLEGDSDNVVVNTTADKYNIPRGYISWFNGPNIITINVHGRELIHTGPDSFASLAWVLGDGMTMNFYVEHIIIDTVGASNSFFPWYGVLNVYSRVTCKSDTSWIMSDGGVSTFYGNINAILGLLYVRGGASAFVILKCDLTSNRPNNAALVTGNLFLYNSTFKSTDVASASSVINLNAASSNLMLNNSKIIADVSKVPIDDTDASPNLVQVYGSCYSVGIPVNITQAPGTITQYPTLQ